MQCDEWRCREYGCFHCLLVLLFAGDRIMETVFKPLRVSKTVEETTLRNFHLKLITEEFAFEEIA